MESCCASRKKDNVTEDPDVVSNITSSLPDLPAMPTLPELPAGKTVALYLTHPVRAMRRFRVPAKARRIYDLETELEGLSAKEEVEPRV